MKALKVCDVDVLDLRVPTSDTLQGSDPFHKKPNWSCVLTRIKLNNGVVGESVCFTSGAGNDWIAYGVKDLAKLLEDFQLNDFMRDPGAIYRLINDHHQLRWLADGVNRMALGCIINALWDLWAKVEHKPMWKLLVDLPSEKVVELIDWRYLEGALSKKEALSILQNGADLAHEREQSMVACGPKAYSTAGWLGLTDEQIVKTVKMMQGEGFDCFKMKVGQNLEDDKNRLSFIRNVIGPDAKLMLDCNQVWGVETAINYMFELQQFNPTWIEEPTARDDVLGHLKISNALEGVGIGVATGEQVPSPVIFKQLLQSGAIQFCQIDATRLGGVNDVLAVILMAKKFKIPVCPHGGGIGLCNMIVHYAVWDQIMVAGRTDNQLVEYAEFLQNDVFENPVRVKGGHYVIPQAYGWGLDMKPSFVSSHQYPHGSIWKDRVRSGDITFLP